MLVTKHENSRHFGAGAHTGEFIECVAPFVDLLVELGLSRLLLKKHEKKARGESFAVELLNTIGFKFEIKPKIHHTKKALTVGFNDVFTILRLI